MPMVKIKERYLISIIFLNRLLPY